MLDQSDHSDLGAQNLKFVITLDKRGHLDLQNLKFTLWTKVAI